MSEQHGATNGGDKDAAIAQALGYFRNGDYEAALTCADEIITSGPEIGLSWRFKGECLFSLGRFDEAISSFSEASKRGGEGTEDMFLWIALCHANSGRVAEAKDVLNHYIRSAADATPDLLGKAQAALQTLNAM